MQREQQNRLTDSVGSSLKHLANWKLYKETYTHWSSDKAGRQAAALAYHSVMAMAPLIIGVLAIVGLVYNTKEAQQQVMTQVQHYVGPQGAQVVNTILTNANQPVLARWAGIVSLLLLLWSASNLFAQVQDALNTAWGVQLRPDLPLRRKIEHRLMPLLIVVAIGILLVAITIGSAILTALASYFTSLLPGGNFLWQILNFLISLAMLTLLAALVFKYLPDVKIAWRDLWPGSLLTAILFVIGQFILGWYLGRQSTASLFGAAGSLIILLLWIYYSAQIFLFGAEFTQVYATHYGHGVTPDKDAIGRDAVVSAEKPVADAANAGATDPASTERVAKRSPAMKSLAAQRGSARRLNAGDVLPNATAEMPLSTLVTSLLEDGSALFEQEVALAKAEMRAMVQQVARGVAMVAGGGMSLYTAALFILLAVALLLSGIMPLWLGLLLVGPWRQSRDGF